MPKAKQKGNKVKNKQPGRQEREMNKKWKSNRSKCLQMVWKRQEKSGNRRHGES
jgi:hypothetical protein